MKKWMIVLMVIVICLVAIFQQQAKTQEVKSEVGRWQLVYGGRFFLLDTTTGQTFKLVRDNEWERICLPLEKKPPNPLIQDMYK